MISSSFSLHFQVPFLKSSFQDPFGHFQEFGIKAQEVGFLRKPRHVTLAQSDGHLDLFSETVSSPIPKFVAPFAASIAIILWSHPAEAGILSGYKGIESVPGPELPKVEFLERFNEDNQKRYADLDARFKESPLLKKLLEKSKENKEKNKQEIQDKYCLRGAEWGVGDCSAEGMTPDERDKFIAMLKQKVGVNE